MAVPSVFYQLRIRAADDLSDALVLTSVPGGTNPLISEPPSGDGQGFDPRTGATEVGAYSVRVADNGSTANAITGFLSDGNGRYDKLGRRAYLAYGTDGTTFPNLLVAGYITGISYASAAEAVVSIGEAQRTERLRQAFVTANSTFPATTMLGGGPVRWPAGVISTPVNWPNRGPWTMKSVLLSGTTGVTYLRFVSGYALTDENATDYTLATNGAVPAYTINRINTLTSTEVPGALLAGTGAFAYLQNGNVYADVYSSGSLVGTFPVLVGINGGGVTMFNQGDVALSWTNADPIGTQYQVYLYTRTISENSPIHMLLHPMDIVTGLIGDVGELWDTTTAAAVKASIGADVRVFLRITQSQAIDAFIALLMGLFGVGRRINSANKWEFFDPRSKSTAAPGVTIAQDDLREIPSDLWNLSDATIINTVTVTAERFAIWTPGQSSTRPPDSLVPVEQKRTARFQLADGSFPDTTQGIKEQSYDLPGTILNVNGDEIDLQGFTAALAAPTFDRWGTGAPSTTLVCRDTVTAKVGDEVLLNLPFLPNANVRGGQRIVQIRQRTNEAGGPVLVVEDAGLSAQPSLAPTFTIVASAGRADTQADLALTNAAALTAAGVVYVLIEWAVSALTPTVAGQDLGALVPASPVVISTPPAAGGSKVWARMKSIQPGKRSGTFTSWAGVTLTAVGAPSGLAFVADGTDGSKGTLSWTTGTGASAYNVRVLRRLTALSAAADQPVVDLLAGSTATPLGGMLPSTNYTVTVQHFDPSTGIVASSTTLAFTSGATVLVLTEPTQPVGIVGRTDTNGVGVVDGTYGLDVQATQIPGTVEFWTAVELLAGTGFFPAALLVFAAPSVSGRPTSYRTIAPHDGLKRKLTARHVATGATSSSFTSAQVLDPWGAVQAPGWIPPALTKWDWTDSPTARTFTWTRNANTHSVWIYDMLVAVGGGSGWPVPGQLPTVILTAGTDTYVAAIPPAGYQRFVKATPFTDRGVAGASPSSVVDPAPVGLVYNQTLAQITASTPTTVDVTVTATATAGTPTVQYVGVTGSAVLLSGPAIGVASPSGTVWVFTRGPALGGTGQAQFRGVLTGNVSDDDFVSIPEQQRDTVYAECRAAITGSTATVETVTVTAAALVGTPTVQLVAVTGSAVLLSGPAIGVPSASGTVWTFTRGAALAGDGQAQFRAVLAGYQSDDDFVEVPEQGRDTVPLAARARVTATTPTTLTVRVAVADPYPQGANTATISYQDQGSGGVSPATGGTVTPASTLTEAASTYIDYTVTRPAFGVGAGRVTFTVTAAGRVSDSDAVDVPEVDRDTVALASRARVTATTPTTVTVRVAVADPFPQGAASGTITYQDQGSGGVSPASGGTVTPAATLTEAAGTYIDYTITRPAFGAGAGRVTFTLTAANRTSDADAIDVPEVDRDTIALTTRVRVTATTPTTLTVRVAVADAFPQGAGSATIAYLDLGSGGVSPASGGTVTPVATITEAAGTYIDYTVTRPAFGVGAGRVTFTTSAANRTSVSDAIDVPEIGRDTVPLTIRGRVTAQSATSITVRVAVADPFPQGAASATISYQDLGSGGVSPASGGTVTPAATITEVAGSYIDYTITLPAFAAGPGRVTFTVTAANRVSAQDAADVPTQDRDTVQITLRADVIASTVTTIDVQLTAVDPLGGTPTISVASAGTPAVTATSLGSNQWRLTKPAWNTASGRVIFQAVLAGRTTAYEGVTVPPQTSQATTGKVRIYQGNGLLPRTNATVFLKDNTRVYSDTAAVTAQFYSPVDLADGVTVTLFESSTTCGTGGGSPAATVGLYRIPRAGSPTATNLAIHTSTPSGSPQHQSTSLSEVIDNVTYSYTIGAALCADAAATRSEIIYYALTITSPDLSKS